MIQLYDVKRKLSLSNFKGSKYLKCPACGKMRLKPYAYEDGSIESEILGRCQREVNCNYHLKPSEYFKDRGESFFNSPTFTKPVPKEIYYLDRELCEKIALNYKSSTLLTYLNKTGINYDSIFEKYKVGAGKFGQTVFFQFDGFKFRAGKIIKYTETGHRDKSSDKPVSWVHKWTKDFDEDKQELDLCFFGLHLVDESNTICLVESEKTAVICAGLFPKAVWLATGGRTQLQAVKLNALGSNKRIILFPDTDSIVYWRDKVKSIGGCEVIDTTDLNKYCVKGADLADFLLDSGPEIARKTYNLVNNLIF